MRLKTYAAARPATRDDGITHRGVIPNILKNAIRIATNSEKIPPAATPLSVDFGTKSATKKSTKSGATTRFTTLTITSKRFSLNIPYEYARTSYKKTYNH